MQLKSFGLIVLGAGIGIAGSLHYAATADRSDRAAAALARDLKLPVEDLTLFTQVYERIKNDYVEPVDDKKLLREAINGMLQGLDPHSQFLDADAFKEMQVTSTGEFGGIGIELGREDGFLRVVAPIEDTPADRAGIKAGDYITKVDGISTKGLNINDAVKKLKGKPGTGVSLTIARINEPKPIEINITRAIIRTKSVKVETPEPGYVRLRVTSFQERTGEDLAKAFNDLVAANAPLKGIVLDLRTNPGGLLNASVAVSAAFLPKDALVVYTDGRTDQNKEKFTASRQHYMRGGMLKDDTVGRISALAKTVPIVVLVNGASASASEIVAGALQDHKRATIIGTPTFGKGSVQTLLPLGQSTAIKLTTAKYYTPNGRSIQAKGIEPDIVINDGRDAAITRERDLNKHLESEDEKAARLKAQPSKEPGKDLTPLEEIEAAKKERAEKAEKGKEEAKALLNEKGEPRDIQMEAAIKFLKGEPVAPAPTVATAAANASATAVKPATPPTKK
jgi:carboxyl-terminal processing protease